MTTDKRVNIGGLRNSAKNMHDIGTKIIDKRSKHNMSEFMTPSNLTLTSTFKNPKI